MSQSQITYTDKVEDAGASPEGLVGADDLNEVKSIVNLNAADTESRVVPLETNMAESKSYSLLTESGETSSTVTAVDPTNGDVVVTIASAASIENRYLTIKRVENGENLVTITSSDLIDGYSADIVLGHVNESVTLYSDGQDLIILNRATSCFANLATNTQSNFSITTSSSKLTTWDTDGYSTVGRAIAESSNNRISIIHHSGATQDGYKAHCNLVLEYDKDKYVFARFFVDGVAVGQLFSMNGLGNGKPFTLSMLSVIGVAPSGSSVEVWVGAESSGTLKVYEASFTLESILG